jgi:phage shock protein PspC (stress-responsive transcriptional regulator)
MKKVININFQGRVIPIEESAYDMLKQYVESLRKFFANEEGRDEIINDIEGRIAELFGESLKKGSTCITDDDVNHIIESMGRPEDFEGEEGKVQSQLGGENYNQSYTSGQSFTSTEVPRGRLYRNDNDKILGGVCGGLASYLRIDPTIVRLVFALISFGAGTGILLYILLWVILPSRPLNNASSTKRLYRNPEEKVVAGVASGIASYFDIAVWIPRLIFALPLVIGIITSVFRSAIWFDVDPFPGIIFGSFGGTLFVVYAVLWAVIPEAKSASEKLEMRGEKVDLNTIKNTIQEDLEGF